MIRLGLRLAVSGGREAVTRLVTVAIAVGIGVGLLLAAVSAVNAVNAQNDRYAWLDTGASNPSQTSSGGSQGPAAPLRVLLTTDEFDGQTIYRADIAATAAAHQAAGVHDWSHSAVFYGHGLRGRTAHSACSSMRVMVVISLSSARLSLVTPSPR